MWKRNAETALQAIKLIASFVATVLREVLMIFLQTAD